MRQHRTTATVLSAICMGLGQLYNRQWIKGVLLLIVGIFSLYYFINNLGDAIWGMTTLGNRKPFRESQRINPMVAGDHSINLLIEGLITMIMFALFLLGIMPISKRI